MMWTVPENTLSLWTFTRFRELHQIHAPASSAKAIDREDMLP
jgi:hypothetical protein